MAIKPERRHEDAPNHLAEFLEDVLEAARPYAPGLLIGAIGIVALVMAGSVYYGSARASEEQAAQEFYEAGQTPDPERARQELQRLAEDSPNASVAPLARLGAADLLRAGGEDLLQLRPDEAKERLTSALDLYATIVDSAKQAELREWARFGIARTQETLGNLEKAREQLTLQLKEFPTGSLAGLAESRLKDLDRVETKDFYDWLAAREQAPRSRPPQGQPDFGGALDDSSFKLPAPKGTTAGEASDTGESSQSLLDNLLKPAGDRPDRPEPAATPDPAASPDPVATPDPGSPEPAGPSSAPADPEPAAPAPPAEQPAPAPADGKLN